MDTKSAICARRTRTLQVDIQNGEVMVSADEVMDCAAPKSCGVVRALNVSHFSDFRAAL